MPRHRSNDPWPMSMRANARIPGGRGTQGRMIFRGHPRPPAEAAELGRTILEPIVLQILRIGRSGSDL
jgi:hypothetical protein